MRMTAKRKETLDAIDRLDEAAPRVWAALDGGSGPGVGAAERNHADAKAALIALVTGR